MPFQNEIDVEQLPGNDRLWKLTKPLVYISLLTAEAITVPTGFVTDFASIPGWVAVDFDIAQRAAVVHDWLYQTHKLPKPVADSVFLEAMVSLGKPAWRRWILYTAVKLFGQSSYDSGPSRFQVLN
jgi:hypothetical protein